MIQTIIANIMHHMPELMEIVIFGFIFYFIERIRPAEKNTRFFKDDMKNEVILAVVNIFIFIPLSAVLATLFIEITLKPLIGEQILAPFIESLPLAIQIILGAIILDLSTYWRHRLTHYYMWSYHSIHHSARQITWITSFRLHPIDLLSAIMANSLILYFLGFSGIGFLGALIIIKIMNYFTHINLDLKFDKPLRYIFASPAYHRWHHATVSTAYNKNFCGAFPFLDLLFGTYYHPEELPSGYGLSKPEQENFPERSFFGWIIYPFKRDWKFWLKKCTASHKKL